VDGREGDPRVGSHPNVQNPEKYTDCRTDLIGGGLQHRPLLQAANTLALPLAGGGIKTSGRRHTELVTH